MALPKNRGSGRKILGWLGRAKTAVSDRMPTGKKHLGGFWAEAKKGWKSTAQPGDFPGWFARLINSRRLFLTRGGVRTAYEFLSNIRVPEMGPTELEFPRSKFDAELRAVDAWKGLPLGIGTIRINFLPGALHIMEIQGVWEEGSIKISTMQNRFRKKNKRHWANFLARDAINTARRANEAAKEAGREKVFKEVRIRNPKFLIDYHHDASAGGGESELAEGRKRMYELYRRTAEEVAKELGLGIEKKMFYWRIKL